MNFKVRKKEERILTSYMRNPPNDLQTKVNKDLIKILETFEEIFGSAGGEEYRSILCTLSKQIENKRIADISFFDTNYDISYYQYFDLLINKNNGNIYLTSYYCGGLDVIIKDYYVHYNFGKVLDEKKMVSIVYKLIK